MIPISPGLSFLTLEGLVNEGPYLVHVDDDDAGVVVVIPGDEIGLIQPNEVASRQDASTHSPDMSEGAVGLIFSNKPTCQVSVTCQILVKLVELW